MSDNSTSGLPRASAGIAEPSGHEPDAGGHFGVYGGRFVAEALMAHFHEAAPGVPLARLTAEDSFIATGPAYAVTMPSSTGIVAAAKGLVK